MSHEISTLSSFPCLSLFLLDEISMTGMIGLAVGATNPRVLQRLREKYDRLFFLVPGYGAQGGRAADAAAAFDKFGHGAIVMAGRSILNAWKKQESDGKDYQAQAREAALRMREQLLGYVTVI